MDIRLMVQSTPNPNALKFVLNIPVKTDGKVTYKRIEDCVHNPLAMKIFGLDHIEEVFFFDNYITVTQNGDADWDVLEEQVKKTVLDNIQAHDPNFKTEEPKRALPATDNPEVARVEEILNQTIRPALQMDGGDIQIISLENNILMVNYQGACGSCPSSSMGTLKAIENILRDQYNQDIVVEMAPY
ncbi:MAG: NifU family protein [Candidatus Omnitrophota bacterium]|nr:NifU family protein [Candidatus Omnitrophota bacterium]MDZ4241773.1 NifU family protein [Candidatus Omnitrophota bacterium]